MEYFFGGMTLSLLGVCTLVGIGMQKGWLKRAAKRIANESEQRSRDRVQALLDEDRALLKTIADCKQRRLQLLSQYSNDLTVVSGREGRSLAQEIFVSTVDLEGSMQELLQVNLQVIQGYDPSQRQVTVNRTEAVPQAAQNGKKVVTEKPFVDTRQYAYRLKNGSRQWAPISGKELNEMIASGLEADEDFFAMPIEAMGAI